MDIAYLTDPNLDARIKVEEENHLRCNLVDV